MLHFLVTLIASVGHRVMALESSAHSIVNVSGFLPVTFTFDLPV